MGHAHTALSAEQLGAAKEMLKSESKQNLTAAPGQAAQKTNSDNLNNAQENDSLWPSPNSSEGRQMSVKGDNGLFSAGSFGDGELEGGEVGKGNNVQKREKEKFGDNPLH